MYQPSHFEETRTDVLHQFISSHPLGTLVVNGPNGLDANHIPFLLEPDGRQGRLLAHVARANPIWQEVATGARVLVMFSNTGGYISPSWYPSKQEIHRSVPTWNYQVVHAHGAFEAHDDEKFVRGVVGRLTREHESRVSPDAPWKMSDSPRAYIDQMVASVVGISVTIESLVGKWKLSQNRDDRDRLAAADGLEKQGAGETASAMRAVRDQTA